MNAKTIVVMVLALAGCRTEFYGSPHIDPATCQQKCGAANLQMAGMVYMGEYSSACICEIPHAPPPAAAPGAATTSAGITGVAVAVIDQMRRDEEERQRQQGSHHY
jgi:hypothetical protein